MSISRCAVLSGISPCQFWQLSLPVTDFHWNSWEILMLSVAKLRAGLGLSRQRIAYTTTIAILLFILWMGHRTHWHFGAAHHPWSAKGHQPNLHATPTDLKSAHNVVQ